MSRLLPDRSGTLLFQRIVPSYRVDVFRHLFEKLGIIVCHSVDARSASEDIDYPNEILPGKRIVGKSSYYRQQILPVLRKHSPEVVITQFSFGFTTFWKLLLLRPVFRYKLISWSHGIRNKDVVCQSKSRHYYISPYLFRMMDAVLFYSHARRESVVQRHTALSTRAFVAVNSMDTKKLAEVRSQLTRDGKIESGVEKGAALHLLYFGKLVKSKRILDLLDAFTLLRAKHSNVTLTVIGGGELESMVRERAESEGFRYLGEIHDVEATAPILEAMDVLVLPGAVGLALVHAYAFGLPVITYASTETGPFHGPELEYLRHGENGLLSNPGPEALSNTIAMLIEDRELLLAMKANALDTEESEANIERMVDGFRQAIAYVTAGKA